MFINIEFYFYDVRIYGGRNYIGYVFVIEIILKDFLDKIY